MTPFRSIAKALLFPTQVSESVLDINVAQLQQEGITTLICDLDNTLVADNQRHMPVQYVNWLQTCQEWGLRVFILSNNRSKKRVQVALKQSQCTAIYLALKPLTGGMEQLIACHQIDLAKCVMIGDQVFKDVVMANWLRMRVILVEPLNPQLGRIAQAQYAFERWLLRVI